MCVRVIINIKFKKINKNTRKVKEKDYGEKGKNGCFSQVKGAGWGLYLFLFYSN